MRVFRGVYNCILRPQYILNRGYHLDNQKEDKIFEEKKKKERESLIYFLSAFFFSLPLSHPLPLAVCVLSVLLNCLILLFLLKENRVNELGVLNWLPTNCQS